MRRRFVVTFGRKQSDAAVRWRLAAARQEEDAAGLITVETGSTPPLRFGRDDGVRFAPSLLADLPDTASKLARLKADAMRELDVFAKNPRRLLDLYFDFIAARLDTEGAVLERLLQPLGGLFRVEDWAFSALRPMPNAAVFDADDRDDPPAVACYDMAFWTGQTVLAIRLRGNATPSPREAEISDRLQAIGARIVAIPTPELATGIDIFSESRFPPEFLSFWQGERYPSSPFRPQGLTRSLSLR